MRAILSSALLAAGLAAAGCTGPALFEMPHDGYVVAVGTVPEGIPRDPAAIRGAAVQGDELVLDVEHGGGCATHEFALYAPGVFMESHPVQTLATLAHDANGDVCRALLRRELRFDLAPLREAYRSAYGRGGTLVLHVSEPAGSPPARHTVTYTF